MNKEGLELFTVDPMPGPFGEQKNIDRFSHHAMATVFEIIIAGELRQYAEQASLAAFDEIDRLERELSRFIESSDIAKINSLSKGEQTIVSLDTSDGLKLSAKLYQETRGAFDVSSGQLIDLWKGKGEEELPADHVISSALNNTGLPWLHLDEAEYQIQLMKDSIQLDLGGVGKGYAVDKVRELFEEWGINSALIHSGQSTVFAFTEKGLDWKWPLSISGVKTQNQEVIKIELNDKALSGSGIQKGQHIIDPRTGYPVDEYSAVWAIAPQAAKADALSTAFMVMPAAEIERYCSENSDVGGMIVLNDGCHTIKRFGTWPDSS